MLCSLPQHPRILKSFPGASFVRPNWSNLTPRPKPHALKSLPAPTRYCFCFWNCTRGRVSMPRYRQRYQHEASTTNHTPQTPSSPPSNGTSALTRPPRLATALPAPIYAFFFFLFFPFYFLFQLFFSLPWSTSRSPTNLPSLSLYNSASPPVCSSRLIQKKT
ncbi:hypothetical protein HDV57DRAFT_38178 [Trichoderma longibrachiatum]